MTLLLNEFKLDKSRLYATYFEGNPKFQLEPDLEAKELWKELYVCKNDYFFLSFFLFFNYH